MGKPILALDFDGVIHSYTTPWRGAEHIPDPIVPGAIEFMLAALPHFDVVIYSSRSHQTGGIAAMQSYLRREAGQAWYETPAGPGLEDVRFVTEKPPAKITIDDRALTFNGTWPSIEALKAFQPWNKRAPAKPGQFTKKAVTIAAAQWFKNGDHPDDYAAQRDGFEGGRVVRFTGDHARANDWEGGVVRYFRRPDVPGDQECRHCKMTMNVHGWIDTLEGGHIVCPGDWIITGVKGERYPCKPDVFAATYEPAQA